MLVLNIRLKGKGALMSLPVSGALTPYSVRAAPKPGASSSSIVASRCLTSCAARHGQGRRGLGFNGAVHGDSQSCCWPGPMSKREARSALLPLQGRC